LSDGHCITFKFVAEMSRQERSDPSLVDVGDSIGLPVDPIVRLFGVLQARVREESLIGVLVHHERHRDLADVAEALGPLSRLAGARQDGEQNADQDRDDPDDDQQFHQHKSAT
jgi:hypothetical protein